MPKRPSSFEEHLLPQIKVHVGEKKMYNETDMKIVYGGFTFSFNINFFARSGNVVLVLINFCSKIILLVLRNEVIIILSNFPNPG